MTQLLYLSRSFVEFGPFTTDELLGFHQRGILQDTDYVRAETSDDWIHVYDWHASLTPATSAAAEKKPAAKKAAAAPAPAAKKAPAKKAAKKKAD
ncbi:MAG TPA: hypothetical protein PK490_18775 [Prosthecobacter sp.]|nr:hypothetical protein [Prosthecobacter sp.]HRK16333.1 hypothetical protein [Prosthecobacter sp.]